MAEVIEIEVKSEGIGELNDDVKDLSENLGDAAKDAKKTDKGVESLGKTAGKSKKGFKLLAGGLKGIGVALKAAGIGLLVALFMALKEAMERNQTVMDAINVIMTTISTTFNQVVDVLVDVYDSVSQSSDSFDALGKVMSGIITLAVTPLKLAFYGIKSAILETQLLWEKSVFGSGDKGTMRKLRKEIRETNESIEQTGEDARIAAQEIVTNVGEAVTEMTAIVTEVVDGISKISVSANMKTAEATIAAQNNAKLAEASLQGLIEKNDLLAEKQRQIRDDETKTFAERLAANKELGEILKDQEKDMLALADTRIAAAKFELDQNKSNLDLQIAYKQTLNDRAGIQAQIGGMTSEQLVNEVSLNKELGELKREIRNEGLDGMAQELAELESAHEVRMEMARRAGEESKLIEEQYLKDIKDIKDAYLKEEVDAQLAADEKTEADTEKEKKLAQDLADYKIDLVKQGLAVIGSLLDNQMARLESDYEKDVELAEANGKSTEQIDETFNAKRTALAEKQKKVKIGLATIDMFTSAVAAYNQGMSVPPPAGLVMGPIAAGLAITAGAANIASIMGTDVGAGGGGGAPATGSTPETPSPQMMSGAFELSGGVEPDPIKAFVVTDEMSNSQNQLANIRRRATI